MCCDSLHRKMKAGHIAAAAAASAAQHEEDEINQAVRHRNRDSGSARLNRPSWHASNDRATAFQGASYDGLEPMQPSTAPSTPSKPPTKRKGAEKEQADGLEPLWSVAGWQHVDDPSTTFPLAGCRLPASTAAPQGDEIPARLSFVGEIDDPRVEALAQEATTLRSTPHIPLCCPPQRNRAAGCGTHSAGLGAV